MATISTPQSSQSTPTSNPSGSRPTNPSMESPTLSHPSGLIQPLTISAMDGLDAIHVEQVPDPQKKLGIFARYPDGRRVLIKEVTGTDLEKAWETLKASHHDVSSDFRVDLSESRLQFQDSENQTHKINLYKENLEPFYKAISKLKIAYEADGKTKERDLSEFINLPTHSRGRRAASQAKAGLQKDDPRLQILKFEKREMVKILDANSVDKTGSLDKTKLKENLAILKRKYAAKKLTEKYHAIIETMKSKAASQQSLAGQSQERRLTQLSATPLDSVAIGFNAVYPFPNSRNLEEFIEHLKNQKTKAKEFIEGFPQPSEVDSAKEELYAKELVLAGLPERFFDSDREQYLDQRELYEIALQQFGLKPTQDPKEVAFIRLAHRIAENDTQGIRDVIAGPSFEVLLEPLNPAEQETIQTKLLQESLELAHVFQSDTLRDPENDTETTASFIDLSRNKHAKWEDLYKTQDGENFFFAKPNSAKLIDGFVAEVEECRRQNRHIANRNNPSIPALPSHTNIEIFKDTQKAIQEGHFFTPLKRKVVIDKASLQEGRQHSKIFSLQAHRPRYGLHTESLDQVRVVVENKTTLQAVQDMQARKIKPFVLVMGNESTPGGGVGTGANAQEETICRQSTLYEGLLDLQAKKGYPIPVDGGLFVPSVQFLRDDPQNNYEFLDQDAASPILADCFVSAPPNLNDPAVQSRFASNPAELEKQTKIKIKSMLECAKQAGKRHLILGAYGCGAFGNDPRKIAHYFKEILDSNEYSNAFDEVVFAIVDDNNSQSNYTHFSSILN